MFCLDHCPVGQDPLGPDPSNGLCRTFVTCIASFRSSIQASLRADDPSCHLNQIHINRKTIYSINIYKYKRMTSRQAGQQNKNILLFCFLEENRALLNITQDQGHSTFLSNHTAYSCLIQQKKCMPFISKQGFKIPVSVYSIYDI